MKRKQKTFLFFIPFLLVVSFCGYYFRVDIHPFLIRGQGDVPTHEAFEGCSWVKRSFPVSGISFFEQNCSGDDSLLNFSEGAEGKIVGVAKMNPNYKISFELFSKESTQDPLILLERWYAELSPEQRKVCEIRSADEPIKYFSDGKVHWVEEPRPTAHKTRYEIAVRKEVFQEISDKHGGYGVIPNESQYDFMCGNSFGAAFRSYPPYFEFDDRSPNKYLRIKARMVDPPLIDLNSIRF